MIGNFDFGAWFATIGIVGCILLGLDIAALTVPIVIAIRNINATLTSVDRIHSMAKLQLYASLLIDFLILYSSANMIICVTICIVQIVTSIRFSICINKHKSTYVPHMQYPMPIVEVSEDDCYDVDLEGVVVQTEQKITSK